MNMRERDRRDFFKALFSTPQEQDKKQQQFGNSMFLCR